MKNPLYLVWVVMLAACAQTPPVKLPELELANQWRTGPAARSSGAPWWKAFQDPALDRLESLALAENLDIQQAQARLEQARDAAGIAQAALAPAIVLDGAVGRVQQSLNSGLGTLSKFVPNYERNIDPAKISFSAAWDLDFAGGLRSQREAAGASVLASAAEWQAVRLATSAELADAYFLLLGAQQQKAALVRQIDLLASQKRIMAVRVRVGAAAQENLDRLSAAIEQLSAPLSLLHASISAQKDRLALLVGRNPSTWELDLPADSSLPIAADPGGDLPVEWIGRRPDLRVAQQRVAAAGANVAAALAEYYPRISLSAALGQDASNYSNLGASKSSYAQTFVGLRWRLFDFGRIDAEVKVAQGKQKEALLAYRAAVLRACADVETSFAQLAAVRERLRHLEEEGKAIRLVAQSVQQSVKAGTASQDDALGVESTVARSDFDVLAARRDLARAIVVAARALGGPLDSP